MCATELTKSNSNSFHFKNIHKVINDSVKMKSSNNNNSNEKTISSTSLDNLTSCTSSCASSCTSLDAHFEDSMDDLLNFDNNEKYKLKRKDEHKHERKHEHKHKNRHHTTTGFIQNILIVVLSNQICVSAFLHHDLAHGNVFLSKDYKFLNNVFGELNLWVNSGCYFTFQELRKMHQDHHINKVDYETVDSQALITDQGMIFKYILLACEFCYIPAHCLFTWYRAIFAPIWKPNRRFALIRTAMVLFARTVGLLMMAYESSNFFGFLLGYNIAHFLAIHVQRFGDCFSHTYELFPVGTQFPRGSKDKYYDMEVTFSVIFPDSLKWIGKVFMLNFNYHNAHHFNTNLPWYALEHYHEHNLVAPTSKRVMELDFIGCLIQYHKHRLTRISEEQGAPEWNAKTGTMD
eukprot:Pgem_evm1s581